MNDFLIDMAIGNRKDLPEFETGKCACGYVTFYLPEGTVASIDGVDEIRMMDGVCKDAFDEISVGMRTEHFEDKTSRYAIILQAENREELMEQIISVKEKLHIRIQTKDGIKGPVLE